MSRMMSLSEIQLTGMTPEICNQNTISGLNKLANLAICMHVSETKP